MLKWYITATKKEKERTSRSFSFLVGVTGFEPAASWSRTKRTTKLCHTPIFLLPLEYNINLGYCQVLLQKSEAAKKPLRTRGGFFAFRRISNDKIFLLQRLIGLGNGVLRSYLFGLFVIFFGYIPKRSILLGITYNYLALRLCKLLAEGAF